MASLDSPQLSQQQPQAVDQAYWGQVFLQHAPFLLRVVERLSGQGAHVEDIVQETFVVAYKKSEQRPQETLMQSWLYRIASNLIKHHKRSLARRLGMQERLALDQTAQTAQTESSESPDRALVNRTNALVVRSAIAKLPFKMREVFVLYELEGLKAREIATLLDLAEDTVRSRLRHGRQKVKNRLQTEMRNLEVNR